MVQTLCHSFNKWHIPRVQSGPAVLHCHSRVISTCGLNPDGVWAILVPLSSGVPFNDLFDSGLLQ